MKTLIASGLKKYARQKLAVGDSFPCEDEHVELLIATKLAKDPEVSAKSAGPKKKRARRARVNGSRGRYQRRDMRTEA